MKNLLKLFSLQLIATLFFFLIHIVILSYLNKLDIEKITIIYIVNFLLVAFTTITTYFIHKQSPEFVGFSYLFLALFKIALVVAILYTQKQYQNQIISFMASYLISLFIEIYSLTKKVFKED